MIKLSCPFTHKMITGTAIAALVLMSACSFHSNQFDAMKRLLKPPEVVSVDRWFLSGPVSNLELYPIKVSDTIIFTDGADILLRFDGWHFLEIRGLEVPDLETNSQKSRVIAFDYLVTQPFNEMVIRGRSPAQKSILPDGREKFVYRINCQDWQHISVMGEKALKQVCVFDGQETFSNSIWLDQSGKIRALETVLGPGGGKIRVAKSNS